MNRSAPRTHIFQIYYSNATREALDPGFVPLDNIRNERPDWREYWPIRRHLLNNSLISLARHAAAWIAKAYNPMLLPFSHSPVSGLGAELAALDALKIAYQVEPLQQYLRAYFELRARYAAMANKK